jgi:hypothetical protein
LLTCKEHEEFRQRFREAAIDFRPTYKYSPPGDDYDQKKSRVPSWCDRILASGEADCLSY